MIAPRFQISGTSHCRTKSRPALQWLRVMWVRARRIAMVPMPYFQKVLNANGTVPPSLYLAGNPSLLAGIGGISGTASVGNQDYQGLQIVWQKRLSGLQSSAAYTYSKCMSNAIGYFGQGAQANQQSAFYQNIYNAARPSGGRATMTRPTVLSRTFCIVSHSAAVRPSVAT